jgi:RpiB/LacA/LacB family sugar-phosphate isomerase
MKKYNLLIPVSGKAKRFLDEGFVMPKPLIMAGDRHIIDWSMQSIKYDECNLIFVVRNEHVCNYSIDKVLTQKFGNDIKIIKTYSDTRGSVETCLFAKDVINNDLPLVIYCLDVFFEPTFDPSTMPLDADGLILTFKSNSPNYSYTDVGTDGFAKNVVEKTAISNNANVGVYCFSKGSDFVYAAEKMISMDIRTNNEFYIAPLYNILIGIGKKIKTKDVDTMHVMGTPKELEFFTKVSLNKFGSKKIAVCCDHSGFELKEEFMKILKSKGLDYVDFGCYTMDDCDQVDYTKIACKSILENVCSHGVGFCRTGQAINIAANKFDGIRSALIFNEYTAEYSIKHNGANFFTVATKFVDPQTLEKMVGKMLETDFEGGRHQVRVQKINDLENRK